MKRNKIKIVIKKIPVEKERNHSFKETCVTVLCKIMNILHETLYKPVNERT